MNAADITVDPIVALLDLPCTPHDPDEHAHIIAGTDSLVASAMASRTPLVALCGYTWIPTRDPEQYPMCPRCISSWEQRAGEGA